VTAQAMHALRATGVAHFTGAARLWQGSNVIQAQAIDFDQRARSITAEGDAEHPVRSVFVRADGKDKSSQMLVTAQRLHYSDSERQVQYSGRVRAVSQDGVLTAGRADIFLNPAGSAHGNVPSRLDRIVATTQVILQQGGRRAEGEKLEYTASTGAYVMSGGEPTLSDPVNGTVRADSLTFYSHDDRVVAEGGAASRAVTRTHVSR
jgi:lipopolysaccharide export system protein LptA